MSTKSIVCAGDYGAPFVDVVKGLVGALQNGSLTAPEKAPGEDDMYWGEQTPAVFGGGTAQHKNVSYKFEVEESPHSYSRMGNNIFSYWGVKKANVVLFALPEGVDNEKSLWGLEYFRSLVRQTENQNVKLMVLRTENPEVLPEQQKKEASPKEYQELASKYRVVHFSKLKNDYGLLLREVIESLEKDTPVWKVENMEVKKPTAAEKRKAKKAAAAANPVITLPSSNDDKKAAVAAMYPTKPLSLPASVQKPAETKKGLSGTLSKFFEFLSLSGSKVEKQQPSEIAPLA